MPRVNASLGKSSYNSRIVPFSAQRCVNFYVSVAQAEALTEYMLAPTPGTAPFVEVGSEGCRGAINMAGVLYVVMGETLYEIGKFGAITVRGTVPGSVRTSLAHNGEKLCIVVPGDKAYVYDSTTTVFVQITNPNFRTADTVCFRDGYYIFTETDSKIFFISNLNDPLTYDPLDFGSAELAADNNVACHVNQDELFILGDETIEVFRNVGGADFPFQRVPGASYEKGCHCRYAILQWEGLFYFLGGGPNERTQVFVAGTSVEPQVISTDVISQEIQEFTREEISNAFGFTYSVEGNSFIGFTFRSVNRPGRTFVYNVTASKLLNRPIWQEQKTGAGLIDELWDVGEIVNVYNKLVVPSVNSGLIGTLETDVFTEYGDEVLRVKTLAPFTTGGRPFRVNEIELTVNTGVGNITGLGEDPQVMMDFSDDGGRLWQNQTARSMGAIGRYETRVWWRRQGRCPAHRIYRFQVSDPVPVAFLKLEMEVSGG